MSLQKEIIAELGVKPQIDAKEEIRKDAFEKGEIR